MIVFLLSILSSCGSKDETPKSSDGSEAAYEQKKAECHAKGKMYDSLVDSAECSATFSLATWPCNRAGLEARVAETKIAGTTPLAELDKALDYFDKVEKEAS